MKSHRDYLSNLLIVIIISSAFLDGVFGDTFEVLQQAVLLVVLLLSTILTVDIFFSRIQYLQLEFWVFLLSIIYAISAIYYGYGFKYSVYLIFCMSACILSSENNFSSNFLSIVKIIIIFFIALIFIVGLFGFWGTPKNTIGGNIIALGILLLIFSSYDKDNFVFIASYFFILVSMCLFIDFRGGTIQLVIVFLGILIGSKFEFKINPLIVFISSISIAFSIVFILSDLEYFFYISGLGDTVIEISHRGLSSGRELIWPLAIELIFEAPLIGHGAGFLIRDIFTEETWSSHNLFIQVWLQVGLIGLGVLSMILYKIMIALYKNENNHIYIVSLFYWISLIVYNSFEVSFFQNSMPIAILQWLIVGILLNKQSGKVITNE
ncbi:O-antigen ligase family protein [Moritella yayanosii]|uniref:O-antigen ligase-related domain-containing protein n=1 Tax=Moritella yayanosii TaxID=69539 RepID=A0A330LSQ7_9GAMM|nr:O-antigen ligase family protein [Moritella yayanosii]SQD79773.1 conserved membrane protein of unknown function, might involved in O-antigen synthesis [Moritella yayanosii]